MKKIGLTLGTYAPFHLGHKLVVDTMRYECDEHYIMTYDDPDRTDIPLYVRSQWLKDMFYDSNIIEAWCGPTTLGYSPEIVQAHNDYILRMAGHLGITHFYSSEPYGEHVSAALSCVNVPVDIGRTKVPVSGTKIRPDPHAFADYIPPRVYEDLITKVVFYGAPSTGKSTLCEYVANGYKTVWVPEYGRTYWNNHNVDRKLTQNQLYQIALGQESWEIVNLNFANRFMFCDTSAITTYMFAVDYFGRASAHLTLMAETAEKRYDVVFVCDDDIPYEDTPDREGEEHRTKFQRMIVSDLRTRQVPYIMLSGSLEERARKVQSVLDNFNKWEVQIG